MIIGNLKPGVAFNSIYNKYIVQDFTAQIKGEKIKRFRQMKRYTTNKKKILG